MRRSRECRVNAAGVQPAGRSSAISRGSPSIEIIRLMLQARTFSAISVRTFPSRRMRKRVDPIQALMVPKGCSTVERRTVIGLSACLSRVSAASTSSSCSQRVMRRSLPVVQCDLTGQS